MYIYIYHHILYSIRITKGCWTDCWTLLHNGCDQLNSPTRCTRPLLALQVVAAAPQWKMQ